MAKMIVLNERELLVKAMIIMDTKGCQAGSMTGMLTADWLRLKACLVEALYHLTNGRSVTEPVTEQEQYKTLERRALWLQRRLSESEALITALNTELLDARIKLMERRQCA